MKHIHHNEAFYQKLGYLFYSIAAADGHVASEEKDALHKMVLEDWITLEDSKDQFGTDAAYQIEVIFDFLIEKSLNGEKAYHAFETYFKENIELFGDEVIERIFHTSNRIAESFHSFNKSELISLTRLRLLLGKERHIL
jgi:hypothetical protein